VRTCLRITLGGAASTSASYEFYRFVWRSNVTVVFTSGRHWIPFKFYAQFRCSFTKYEVQNNSASYLNWLLQYSDTTFITCWNTSPSTYDGVLYCMDVDHKLWLQENSYTDTTMQTARRRRVLWSRSTIRTELTRLRRASQITAHGCATGDEDTRTVTCYFLLLGQTRDSGILSKRLKRVYVCTVLHAVIMLHDSIYN
jgi:hypothetical protein